MYTKDQDELYDEMWRLVVAVVFTMCDFGIESKQIVIADMLRTSLAHKDVERPDLVVKAMELAIRTLEK